MEFDPNKKMTRGDFFKLAGATVAGLYGLSALRKGEAASTLEPWTGGRGGTNIFDAPPGWSKAGSETVIKGDKGGEIKVPEGTLILNISTVDKSNEIKKTVIPGSGLGMDGKLVMGYAIDDQGNEVHALGVANLIVKNGSNWKELATPEMFDRAMEMAKEGFGYSISPEWRPYFLKEQELRLQQNKLQKPLFVKHGVLGLRVDLETYGPKDPTRRPRSSPNPSLIPQ